MANIERHCEEPRRGDEAISVCALGIDVGSTTVKIVGVDAEGNLAWHLLEQAEPRVEDQVERLLAWGPPQDPPPPRGV